MPCPSFHRLNGRAWPAIAVGPLLVGYSHFFPGDVIDETGPHSSTDFGYTALQFTFQSCR